MIYGICTVGGYDADLGEYAGSDRLGTGKVTYYSTWSAAKNIVVKK